MVQRSIAWLVAGRNRRVRNRGTAKNNAWRQTCPVLVVVGAERLEVKKRLGE